MIEGTQRMKKTMKHSIAFLIIWLCSGVCFAAYQSGNVTIGIASAVLGLLGYFLWINNKGCMKIFVLAN